MSEKLLEFSDFIPESDFLGVMEPEQGVKKHQRIFVNRNLKLEKVRAIGFDMDHTLAVYNRDTIEPLAVRLTSEKLLEKGYPEELLCLKYDKNLMIRGLVIDKVKGNLLKVDKHGYIISALHGSVSLSSDDRRREYQNLKIDLKDQRFYSIDTLFGIPEIFLFYHLIVMKDSEKFPFFSNMSYNEVYDDIRNAIDLIHRDGSMKSEVLSKLHHYFIKDSKLALSLHRFRKSGKKLFLLTNSEEFYTEKVLDFLLSGELPQYQGYRDYFDLIVYQAGKPGFYQSENQFRHTGEKSFESGNAREMEKLLSARGDEILYFGDHTFGDILVAKKYLGWRTAMVIEELEAEIKSNFRADAHYQELYKTMQKRDEKYLEISRLFRQINHLRLKKIQNFQELTPEELQGADSELMDLFDQVKSSETGITGIMTAINNVERTIKELFNPLWGPLFKSGMEMSNFGKQVENYACVYTSRVSNFFYYPADKYFKVLRDIMPHEL